MSTAKMTIKTKCERVQPVCVGTDKRGELIWEGHTMERWQMEMFKTAYDTAKEFCQYWWSLAKMEAFGEDFEPHRVRDYYPVRSKKHLEQMRRAAPRKGVRI